MGPGTIIQLLCGALAALFFLVVQLLTCPFATREDNRFASVANVCLVVMLLCCMVLKIDGVVRDLWSSLSPDAPARCFRCEHLNIVLH